ncbi:MAG: hypothetical protein QME93_06030 [Bacillota bacterium]|nr:hypothetical protein [Bacillota bacterium]MDI7249609.1 hypothetical protein [Bacillota bacterium]
MLKVSDPDILHKTELGGVLAGDLGDHIEQMGLNPVIVYPDRAVVVDAKLRLNAAGGTARSSCDPGRC